ncbi:MAG: cold shock domain-containing protein [Gemmatimonadetes bacterium]|nr:cold shock domain-containing protein [Gemmatimonadota bacterium]NNK47259.1 cold shock domain-containing protein [Gemmatimonadota bacterium]
MTREKGIVKWFSTDKGYGFIRREDGAEIFVHHTDIEVDGYASLKNGETVEFDVFESDRGPKARNLVPMEADGSRPAARARTGDESKKSEGQQPGNRGRSAGRKRPGRSGASPAAEAAGGKKTLAAQLRERLGRRFPGLGA